MTAEQNWLAEWRTIAAGTLLTLSGSAIFYIMPIYLGSMMEALALNPKLCFFIAYKSGQYL